MHRLRTLFLALLTAAAVPAVAAGSEAKVAGTALGADGRLVSLLEGSYSEIFPEGTAANASEPVLALRTTLADGSRTLQVVPATIDYESEESAELVVEPESGVSYIFWQSWRSEIHSRFRVVSFDGDTWGEPIEVSGPSALWRIHPAFAVTQDSFVDLSAEDSATGNLVHRTVLHITWLEEADGARWQTLYTPLVLVGGQYVGDHPVVVLDDLAPGEGEALSADLQIAPVLRPRDSDNSVVAAFLNQRSGRLAAVELKFAAGELSILGDAVEAEIERFAATGATAGGDAVEGLVKAVQGRLRQFDDQVKPEILDPLMVGVANHLRGQLPNGAPGIASIKGGARAHVIDVGFRLTTGKVARATAVARAHVIDVGARNEGPRKHRRHDARSSVTGSRALPVLSSTPELLVSSSGKKLMLVWQDEDRVRYQESDATGGWKETQQIVLTLQIDAAEAMGVLAKRIERQ